jgi:ankyrin repeat protein
MTALPRNLFCLNLAYNIDDEDVIEQLLTHFPEETEQCIPIALRSTLEAEDLPSVPFFSSQELIEYLSLLWSGAAPDRKLLVASGDGLIYLVAYYLDRGADIHAYDDRALKNAAENGHTETVKLLLDRGADIHAVKDYALRWAAAYGQAETIELLLDRKADIHAKDDEALREAVNANHIDTTKLLLERKANIHAADNDYQLKYIAKYHPNESIDLLVKYGANLQ